MACGIGAWLEAEPGIRRLGIFAALPGEPDLGALHGGAPSVDLHYPLVLAGRRLSFHRVVDRTSLVRGRYGILEPNPSVHPEVAIGELEAILCPGLSFDSSGTRLGRGGGFYDRALVGGRVGIPRVGVCFGVQTAATLPREPHDMVMTHLADEAGVRGVIPNRAGSW